MLSWLSKLQHIKQRWLYIATGMIVLIPFVVKVPMPPGSASDKTRGVYEMVDKCPPDKVVLIDSSWDPGSASENMAQMACVVRHMCKKGIKFVITSVTITPFGPEFANSVVKPIAEEYGYVYGRDWVNTGFLLAGATAYGGGGGGSMRSAVENIFNDMHSARPVDYNGTPIGELELMKNVHSSKDTHMVYAITYCPDITWITVPKSQHGLPVAFACMTIMETAYLPYVDSKQLCGLMVGSKASAEYEFLTDEIGKGTTMYMAASFGNCVVILAAIIGNIGFWAGRISNRRKDKWAI